jgi:predicted nuclease with TOPRIM domain
MEAKDLLTEMNSTVVATVAGLVVGVVMKFASKLTDRRKDNLAEHLQLRKELREELDAVKAEISVLQEELNQWRERYYQQVELTTILQAELASMRIELSEYTNSGEFHSFKHKHEQ